MHYSTKHIVRISALILCLCCSACLSMQQQIDTNSRDLGQMRNQLSRSHNDVEKLRSEIQTLSGTLEENNVVKNQEIKEIKKRLDSIAAILTSPSPGTNETLTSPVANLTNAPLDNEQAHYDRALKLYRDRNYEKSQSTFQTFIKQYKGSPLAQNAFFWIGMSLFQGKDYQDSISAFEELIKKFPQSSKIPDAYYWQALGFIELKEMLTAQILLETLMQTYPSSEASQKAKTKYQELKFDTSR
jgi:tol-pal system protein YbgF